MKEAEKATAALTEMSGVLKKMTRDLLLSDVLEAYDCTERALKNAEQYAQGLPPQYDLVFRLRGVREQLFKIRVDLDES